MPIPALNKQALNSLTELYLCFLHLVEYRQQVKRTEQKLDVFYMRGLDGVAGLKPTILAAYEASNLDPALAGTSEQPLTPERLFPYKTVNSYTNDAKLELIQDVYSDLKYYNDAVRGHEGGKDDVSIVVIEKAEEILRKLRLRDSSGSEDTQVDLMTAHVAHERHTLLIGHVRIRLQANSIMDLATNYMVNEVRKSDTKDSSELALWVTNHPNYIGNPTTAQGVKHALNDVNDMVTERTESTEKLFDTSPRNGVIRNF
ncbi:hypothetical protein KC953_03880 [Candidatus Saccharibacteria bacterium]|nr:hypothetical protein [Candidatus Saccharibacteria bacterium]